MINCITMLGRLTADPELRETSNGIAFCRFSIAVERPYRSGEEKKTDFFNCVAWRQTAEFIEKYFTKGQMIAIVGSLRTGEYTNAEGDKVRTVDINVESVSFTGDKRSDEPGETKQGKSDKPRKTRAQRLNSMEITPDMDPDQDLPF